VRFAELDLARQDEQLRFDVSNDYFNIQQADALVLIAQAAVENSRISLRDTQARERAGLGTRFDVLQAQVQLANNLQQLAQSQSQQQTARRQLAQRLNINDTATLSAADPIRIAGRWTISLADSILMGLKNRVELEQQLVQRNIALRQRRIALSNLGPQVSVGATFNSFDALDDRVAPNWGYSVNGQLGMTLFDGGAARANAAQQSASVAIAEAQFANFKNLIRFQIERSYFTLQSNLENIQTNQAAVQQSTEGLRLARLRFQAGVGTQLEVSNAETALTRSQTNLLSATIDYNRALTSLQRFVSKLPLTPAPAPQ
jgi:outer membrane factor, OMF family